MGVLNYLEDSDLEFLSRCTKEELEPLVHIITRDKDGNLREAEDLTLQKEYKLHAPDHTKYWWLIAADYQYFGGNTLANLGRGHGVPYKEILVDVCKNMKVGRISVSVEQNEKKLLSKFMTSLIENMSTEEAQALLDNAKIPSAGLNKGAMVLAVQAAIQAGGFASYQLAVIVANAIARQLLGHGLAFGANAALTRGLSVLAGPIGIVIAGIWTGISLAGPATRVTIPATIYIALLRNIKKTQKTCASCNTPLSKESKFCGECGEKV